MRLRLVNMGLFSQATPFMGVVVDSISNISKPPG